MTTNIDATNLWWDCHFADQIFTPYDMQKPHFKMGVHLHRGRLCTEQGSLSVPYCTAMWFASKQKIRTCWCEPQHTHSWSNLYGTRFSWWSVWWTNTRWLRSHSTWGKPKLLCMLNLNIYQTGQFYATIKHQIQNFIERRSENFREFKVVKIRKNW